MSLYIVFDVSFLLFFASVFIFHDINIDFVFLLPSINLFCSFVKGFS